MEISEISHEFFINKLFVTPEINGVTNAVTKVIWTIALEYKGVKSYGMGECFFNVDSISLDNFISIDSLEEAKVIEWVEANIGQGAIDSMKQGHSEILLKKDFERNLVAWDQELLNAKVQEVQTFYG